MILCFCDQCISVIYMFLFREYFCVVYSVINFLESIKIIKLQKEL